MTIPTIATTSSAKAAVAGFDAHVLFARSSNLYKSLAQVERAIRSLKTVDLHIRPIFHWTPQRVRAHVCLCMLAYHVEWHLRQRLALMLYDDADKATAETRRASVVANAQRSPSTIAKQTHGTTPDGLPVHSLQTLLADLATLARIRRL
jgi:hypothetical protein